MMNYNFVANHPHLIYIIVTGSDVILDICRFNNHYVFIDFLLSLRID